MEADQTKLVFGVLFSLVAVVFTATDPNDLAILNQFRKGLKNPELLNWPENGDDPCGIPRWDHVFCSGSRVSQIQVQNLGLKGPLPQNLNQLSMLTSLGLQRNQFSGQLPSLSGLSELRYAYFDFNEFDSIPSDFFDGLVNLEVLELDNNNLNVTTGWSLPSQLQNSAQLRNLTLVNSNLVGPLPEFLGNMSSLAVLKLSMNTISGGIPASFKDSNLEILWLNNQKGGQMTGPIDVVATMLSLTTLWLHGNKFSGPIPENIGDLTSLKDLNLNSNQLVGLIPDSLASLELNSLDLNNNQLMGPIPNFKAVNVSYDSNQLCQSKPGVPCAKEVMVLLEFLGGLNYPNHLVSSWSGNDPCEGPWLGLSCADQKVSIINLPKFGFNGTLSPSLANLESLSQIRLPSNNITGQVPTNWTSLKSLTYLDLSGNNISPPFPNFSKTVKLVLYGNPLLSSNHSFKGALSKHLFHWKSLKLEPLSWKRRLNIALDVARGMEYLHTLAHQTFIHRDLKSSNILLGDDYRAKVSDFGLVKLAPDGEKSVVTKLAGTFGYLAPEYAVTGKITVKVDVFSFGVVLMELLTGLMALDEDRPEESQYLAAWFWHIKSNKEKLMAAIDPVLDKKEETLESISTIAELAGHCTAREPSQRPEMGHAVNVLAPLVEKWKPFDDDTEEYSGIDYSLPLNQMVKGWQEAEGKDFSYLDLEDSKGSIPARPTGFADSFTSADGR
ncbi:unnamed protein product, partial [Vitis vinifera]